MKHIDTRNLQAGAVSLFVVIFSALLITIVTVSFVQIMLRGQQEATAIDLSQSAYDSAMGGVEDAKRALVLAAQGDVTVAGVLDARKCNSVKNALGGDPDDDSEMMIRQNVGDDSLSQAYTCVKVNRQTDSVTGSLTNASPAVVIPLTSGGVEFNKVTISWRLHQDASIADDTVVLPTGAGVALPQSNRWDIKTPALMRAQLVQYNSSFTFDSLNSDADGRPVNTSTKFLYPKDAGAPTGSFASNDVEPSQVECTSDPLEVYKCSITLDLLAINTSTHKAFLQLTALYNQADYMVELENNGTAVKFLGVQAEVDSTGRAGDVFRRVSAKVDLSLSTGFPYPTSALELDGNLCKTFQVTDTPADFLIGTCTPWS